MSNQTQTKHNTSSSSTFTALDDPMLSLLDDLNLPPDPSRSSHRKSTRSYTYQASLGTIEEEKRSDESGSHSDHEQHDGRTDEARHKAPEDEWEYTLKGLNIAHSIGVL